MLSEFYAWVCRIEGQIEVMIAGQSLLLGLHQDPAHDIPQGITGELLIVDLVGTHCSEPQTIQSVNNPCSRRWSRCATTCLSANGIASFGSSSYT